MAAPCHERLVAEEAKTTPVHRLLASFTHSMPVGPTQSPLSARHQDDDLRWYSAGTAARAPYVRRLYRVDPAGASLYHMVIDSTAIPLDTVIELVLTAARSHRGESISESSTP